MVSVSSVKSASANNYKYTMANKDYEALARELGNSQYTLAAEEAFRQRKGITNEKKNASIVVQQPQPKPAQSTQTPQAAQSNWGYVVTMSHAQQNAYVREKQSNPSLTEDEFRRRKGVSTERSASIKYVAPKLTGNNPSAASTGNKSTGISNTLTGSQKIAAQSKGTSTPIVVKKTTSTPTKTTPKTTVSLNAAKSGNAAKTTPKTTTPVKTTVVKSTVPAKTVVSLAAAKSGNAAKTSTSSKPGITQQVQTAKKTVVGQPKTGLSIPMVKTNTTPQPVAANAGSNARAKYNRVIAGQTAQKTTTPTKISLAEAASPRFSSTIDRTGQIQLADGRWISQVEKQGNSKDSSVKLYTASLTKEEKAQNQTAYQQRASLGQSGYKKAVSSGSATTTAANKNAAEAKAKAAEAAAKTRALQQAFTGNTKIGQNGQIIDAIQSRGSGGTGEQGISIVTRNQVGEVTGLSKSVSQFKAEAKQRAAIASIPIKSGMSEQDIATIKQARAEVQARSLLKLTYPGDDKYADPEAYAREYKRIGEATKNMSMDEKRAYLKNTITTQMEGKSTTQDLVFAKGTRYEKPIPKIQAFDVINAISAKERTGEALTPAEQHFVNLGNQDYTESKTAKWINTRLNNAGEWTSQKLLSLSGNEKYTKGSDWAGITSNKDTQNKLASVWTSAREGFYGDSPKFLTGFGSLVVTDVDYAAQQLVKRGPVTGGRNIGNKVTGDVIGILGGSTKAVEDDPTRFVAGMIGASAIHTAVKKPVSFTVRKTVNFGKTATGIARRETVIEPVVNDIPFKEAGAILDELTSGKTIRGSRGSSWTEKSSTLNTVSNQVKQLQFGKATNEILNSSKKKGEKIVGKGNYKGETYPKDPAKQKAWNYDEPGTYGKPVVFQAVREGNVNVVSERFINKGYSTLTGTVINKLTDANKVAKVGKTADNRIYKIKDRTAEGGERAPITLKEKVGVGIVKTTDKTFGIRSTDGKIVTKVKKGIAVDYTRRTIKPTPLKERRIFDQEVRAVDLTKTTEHRVLQERMIKSFKETGQFITDSQGEIYKKILEVADEQSKLYDEPIAAPSPKLASGSRAPTGLQAENEVVLVMTGPSSNIMTSRQWIGNAADGTRIERVRYGKQTPLPKRSIANRMFENYQYNVDVNLNRMGGSVGNKSKIIKPGFYNRHHFESMLGDITRKKAEIYDKTALTRPGAYTGGKHGLEHAEKVTKNMEPQRSKSGTTPEYEDIFGKYHDMAKTGAFDSARMGHGSAIYEAIKLNKIDDPALKSLTDAERRQLAKDLGVHDFIKPLNLKNGITGVQTALVIKPTKGAKAGANADRIELTRFNIKPDPKRMFTELLPDGSPYKPITTVTKIKNAANEITTSPAFKSFVANEAAEFVWNTKTGKRTIKSDLVLNKDRYTTIDGIFGKKESYRSGIKSMTRKQNEIIAKSEKQSYPGRTIKSETVHYYEKPSESKGFYKPTPFSSKSQIYKSTAVGQKNISGRYNPKNSYIKTNKRTIPDNKNKNIGSGYKTKDSYIKRNTELYVNSDAYKPPYSDTYKPSTIIYKSQYSDTYKPEDNNYPRDNNYPDNNYPNNDYPDNNYPDNNYPDNNYPDNSYPDNNYPDNNYPHNNYPDNNYPGNSYPDNYPSNYPSDGGNGGGYSGYVETKYRDLPDDGERITRKRKSEPLFKRPMRIENAALMISKTKVNTFSEMMGHTGEKASYGSEVKVTKRERPSPFNKKVVLSTIQSFTPVAYARAEKPYDQKLKTMAKTPAKVTVGKTVVVQQKTSQKPTLSKPVQPSNGRQVISKPTSKTSKNPFTSTKSRKSNPFN